MHGEEATAGWEQQDQPCPYAGARLQPDMGGDGAPVGNSRNAVPFDRSTFTTLRGHLTTQRPRPFSLRTRG